MGIMVIIGSKVFDFFKFFTYIELVLIGISSVSGRRTCFYDRIDTGPVECNCGLAVCIGHDHDLVHFSLDFDFCQGI